MRRYAAILFTILIGLNYSCTKDTEEPVDMGYDYFPTEVGLFQIYSVDSIVFNDYTHKVDTFHYQVKMQIVGDFTDNANNEAYRWRKSTKTDTTAWVFCSNYTISRSSSNIETVIENSRMVNLVFPVTAGKQWDANAKNIEKELTSIYSDVDYNEYVLGVKYINCAKASYEDELNLIQEFVYYEIYSKNIGMIKRKRIHKEEKTTGTSGYNVEYNLISYGKE